MVELVWLIPALPLAGFAVLLLAGPRLGEPRAGWLATAASAGSFLFTLITFGGLLGLDSTPGGAGGRGGRWFTSTLFEWMPIGGLEVDAALLVDSLSMTMALFVTGVGTLIHLYSVGYMHGDPKYSKFFLYLNLFLFSMLMLVLGENLVVTFLGWEGRRHLLLPAHLVLARAAHGGYRRQESLRHQPDRRLRLHDRHVPAVDDARHGVLRRACGRGVGAGHRHGHGRASLLLLLAAAGKSAQLPLYVWLPDAMEGPDPGLGHGARGHDGDRWRVSAGAAQPGARRVGLGTVGHCHRRCCHGPVRGARRGGTARHQEGAGVLHRQPARLHVPRHRLGCICGGDLPCRHPRVLQGPAVPGLRLGHPRSRRRAGHAPDGCAASGHARHRRHFHRGVAGDCRRAAAVGLLVEGRDPAGSVGAARCHRGLAARRAPAVDRGSPPC